jgi:transcriptional regulator with XRE-family HTH domain
MVNKLDLRNLKENQFEDVFYSLKNRTKNFTEIAPEMVLENNQYLLILRICTGLTQKEFAKKLGVCKDWCRHTESGRNKIIHLKVADRYAHGIEKLLRCYEITIENAVNNWNNYITVSREQVLQKSEVRLKQISKMSEKEFESYFNMIKDKTDNFTLFEPDILVKIPQSLVIFRIVLGMNHRKFAGKLGIDSRTIRKYEYGEMGIKSFTAIRFAKNIENLFKQADYVNVKFESVLENFRTLTNFYGNRNLEAMIRRGLEFAKNHPMSDIEMRISNILKSGGLNFDAHGIVEGAKRKLNVDFVIPPDKPEIVIETTSFTIGSRKLSQHRTNICHIDHRFQMLKKKNPKFITIMVLEFTGRPIFLENARKLIESELLNTDHLLINNEIEKLPDLVEKILKNK